MKLNICHKARISQLKKDAKSAKGYKKLFPTKTGKSGEKKMMTSWKD